MSLFFSCTLQLPNFLKFPLQESVTGLLCDECEYGHYNLQEDREEGCQECFCFGITDNCTVASMAYYKVTFIFTFISFVDLLGFLT